MKPPRHSGSPSRQRKGDCFMHEPRYAGEQAFSCEEVAPLHSLPSPRFSACASEQRIGGFHVESSVN